MWTSLGDIILPTLKLQVLPILKSRGIRWGIHNSKQGSLGSLLPEGDWLSSVTRSEASDGALSQASLHFCLHHPSTVAPECEGFFHYEPQKPTLADISKYFIISFINRWLLYLVYFISAFFYLLQLSGSRAQASVVVAHGFCYPTACGIVPDQRSNPRPLHW